MKKSNLFLVLLVGIFMFSIMGVSAVGCNYNSPTESTLNQDYIFTNISTSTTEENYAFSDFNGDLALYLNMDDVDSNGVPRDLSFGKKVITRGGSATQDDGYWGKSFNFSGTSSDYIKVTDGQLDFLGNQVTISYWAKSNINKSSFSEGIASQFYIFENSANRLYCRGGDGSHNFSCYSVIDGNTKQILNYDGELNEEEWNNHLITINGTNITFYLNGVNVANDALGADFSTLKRNFFVRLGADDFPARSWNGQLDDFIIINRLLDQNEISSLYNATENQYYHNNTDLAYSSYLIQSFSVNKTGDYIINETSVDLSQGASSNIGAFSPGNQTTLSSYFTQLEVENSGSSFLEIFASNGTSSLNFQDGLLYKNLSVGSLDNITYDFTIMPTKKTDQILLIRFDNTTYPYDNGNNSFDFSDNHLLTTHAGTYTQGKFGYGIDTYGNSITVANDDSLNVSDEGEYSINMWVRWTGGDIQGLFSKGAYNDAGQPYAVYCYNTGSCKWWTKGLSDEDYQTSVGLLEVNEWVMVSFVWNGTTKLVYKNGDLFGSEVATGTLLSNSENLNIGDSGINQDFNGTIDDFSLLNRTLSALEIQDLYIKRDTFYWKIKADDGYGDINSFQNIYLSCSSTSSCNSELQSSNPGQGVIISKDFAITRGSPIQLNKEGVILDGNGHFVAGQNGDFEMMINISNQSVVVKNLRIKIGEMPFYINTGSENTIIQNVSFFQGNRQPSYVYSDNVTFKENTWTSTSQSSLKIYGDNTNITNNTFRYGLQHEIRLESGSQNTMINDNQFVNNYGEILNVPGTATASASNNTFTYGDNSTMINQKENRQHYSINDNIIFNLTFYNPNGTTCSDCSYNLTKYSPDTITETRSGENLSLSFTPTYKGIHSVKINVTDSNGNYAEKRFFFWVGMTTEKTRFYLSDEVPSHYQYASANETNNAINDPFSSAVDTSILTSTIPSGEKSRACLSWIQLSIDEKLGYLPLYITKLNISTYYSSDGNIYLGFNRINEFGTPDEYDGTLMDNYTLLTGTGGTRLSPVYNFTSQEYNNLNVFYDAEWSEYMFGIQLAQNSQDPWLMGNDTFRSFTDFTYLVTDLDLSYLTDNVSILEFSHNSDKTILDTTLDGHDNATLVFKMKDYSSDYTITYDGVECSLNDNCTINSQSNGLINITVTLGSEHSILVNGYVAPSSNTGGGVSGGDSCSPVWDCGSWSFCNNGISTRTCSKLNSCSSNSNKPDTEKTCSVMGSLIEKIGSPVIDPIIQRLNCGAKPTFGEWGECNSNDITTRINYECTAETNYEWLSFTDEKVCSKNKGTLSSFGDFFTKTTPDFFTKSIPDFFKSVWDFISFWN